MNVVLLAGGGGSRLWPISRQDRPKQLEAVVGDRSLLVQTYERIAGDVSVDQIFISTRPELQERIARQLPMISADHYILEPEKRDTGPAMGWACVHLMKDHAVEPVAFLPTDQLIHDREQFNRALRVADRLIRETGKLIDIGVVPTTPNTNLGYTRIGKLVKEVDGLRVMEFKGHTEKPPLETAIAYLKSGEYLWHANYYMWTPKKFLGAIERTAPQLFKPLNEALRSFAAGDLEMAKRAFLTCDKVSFDYAVTEHLDPQEVLILPATFDWSDVGQWSVVKQRQEENPEDNVTQGEVHCLDTENCIIYGKKGKVIATVGLRDMIVIDTEDGLLICPMGRDGDVKKIVDGLKDGDLEHYV